MVWLTVFLLVKSVNLSMKLYKRYVDDGTIKAAIIEPGYTWDSRKKWVVLSIDLVSDKRPHRRRGWVSDFNAS